MILDADELQKWAEQCSAHMFPKLLDKEKRFWIVVDEPSMVRGPSMIIYDETHLSMYRNMGFRIIEVTGSRVVQPGTCEEFNDYLYSLEDPEYLDEDIKERIGSKNVNI